MHKLIPCLLLSWMTASYASAQVVYEPVRFQYRDAAPFYYGGSDPAIIAYGYSQPKAGPAQLTIYSDSRPKENVAIYGATVSDARDQANANLPRYFCKRDLLAAARPMPDGTFVVGAQFLPIASPRGIDEAAAAPQPILIIPRGQIIPPLKSNNVVISMN